jgi:vitamin B12 transporter
MRKVAFFLPFALIFGKVSGGLAITSENAKFQKTLEEIVVTATRTPEPVKETASSVTVITGEELEEQGITTLAEALREVAGIAVVQYSFGGETSVFVRGVGNGQTVIMIDGVPVYDPAGTSKNDFSFFLPHLKTADIDRIEIVRGPQSVLFGSGAIGGVINIITKQGKKKSEVKIHAEGGSYSTFTEGISLSGISEDISYAVSINRMDSKGISKTVSEPDKDAYHSLNVATKVIKYVNSNLEVGVSSYYVKADQDLDLGVQKSEAQIGFVNGYVYHKINDNWQYKIKLAYTSTHRSYDDGSGGEYDGELLLTSWQNEINVNKFIKLVAGVDYQKEWAETQSPWGGNIDESAYEIAPFAEAILKHKKFIFNTGIRYTKHELAGKKTTYRIAGAFIPFKQIKIHASYGTGFRSPGLYQLFDPTYGNKNLKPEKSKGYDAGVTLNLIPKKILIDVTHFHNDIEDMIDWVGTCNPVTWVCTGQYQNVNAAKTSGIEVSTTIRPINWLKFTGFYTYLSAKDANDQQLPRRPKHRAGFDLTYYLPKKKGDISLRGLYVGEYKDNGHDMGKYFVAHLAARFKIHKNFTLTGRIENLFSSVNNKSDQNQHDV